MIKNNNKGFSLSLVIAIMVITSLLVAAVIVIVTANYNMKATQKSIDSNKYNAEKGLQAIVEDLQEVCESQLENAYQKTLIKYGTEDSKTINNNFAIFYVKGLAKYFNEHDVNTEFEKYLDNNKTGENNFAIYCKYLNSATIDSIYSTEVDESGNNLVYPYFYIRNVGVTYEKPGSEGETIVTDLKIKAPDLFVSNESSTSNIITTYGNFSLMTDRTISLVGTSNVDGDVYGGGHTDTDGVYGDGFSLGKEGKGATTFTSDNVITRGDLTIYDSDKTNRFIIMGKKRNEANVYVNNIKTADDGTTNTISSKYTVLKTYANLYVRNDTLLNRPYMCVNMSGMYNGFSTTDSKEQSAFNINARYVNANLSGLSTLLLAGTSYLDLPISSEDSTFVEIGDSLTGKFSQSVYMIPAKCVAYAKKDGEEVTVKYIGNPISSDLYNRCQVILTKDSPIKETITDDGEYIVLDYYKLKQEDNLDAYDYIDVDKDNGVSRITPVYKEQMSIEGGIRTYLYFNFKSKEAASNYLIRFNEVFKKYINHSSQSFEYGTIKIGADSTLHTVGNVLTNKNGKVKILANTNKIIDNYIISNEATVNKEYYSLASTLQEYNKVLLDSYNNSCFEYIINESNINSATEYYTLDGTTSSSSSTPIPSSANNTHFQTSANIAVCGRNIDFEGTLCEVLVCDGDVIVPSGTYNGLIVTTGKCILNNGVTFTGTIMAKNGIEVHDLDTITNETSSGSILAWLLATYDNKNVIRNIFKQIGEVDTTENTRNAVDIVYKNWMVY